MSNADPSEPLASDRLTCPRCGGPVLLQELSCVGEQRACKRCFTAGPLPAAPPSSLDAVLAKAGEEVCAANAKTKIRQENEVASDPLHAEHFVPAYPAAPAQPRKAFHREIELDFIRGIAILLVLNYHNANGALLYPFRIMGFEDFGWVGVDIFFVLSGFLVGGLLVKEWKVRGCIDGKRFLIRRAFKIWPQYYVFLGLNLFTGHRPPRSLLGNFLNVQNYFHGIPHTWSLAVEEHAYLLLVLCMAVAARRKTRMRNLFFFLAAVTFCVFVMRLVLINLGYDVFPWTHTRIDGILYGVMLAILYHYVPDTFRSIQKKKWIWLAIIAAALLYFRFFNASVPWMLSLSWDFGSATGIALIMLLYNHREGRIRPRIYRLVAFIGLYSYGIYLWHIAVRPISGTITQHLLGRLTPNALTVTPIIGGILIGMFFTKLVEFPTLRLRDRLFPRRVYSAVGVPAELLEQQVPNGSPAGQTSPALVAPNGSTI